MIRQYHKNTEALTCPLPGEIHCIPTARYIGTQILYNHHIGDFTKMQQWLTKAIDDYPTAYHEIKNEDFCNYFFILSEYLFLGGFFHECLETLKYISNDKWPRYFKLKPFDLGYYEIAKLMVAVSNIETGKIIVGKKMLASIDPTVFTFTKRKLYTMQLLKAQLNLCSGDLKVKRKKIKDQIDELIGDTGFTYFQSV